MTFRETHVTQLSSPTTCYSGLKNGSQLASATHIVEMNEFRQRVRARPISLPSDSYSCVGFACIKDDYVYCLLERKEPVIPTVDEGDAQTIMSAANEASMAGSASRRQSIVSTPSAAASQEPVANPITEESSATVIEKFKAELVWQQHNQTELKLPLDTRPLTPHLSSDGLLWIGSADDCLLKCYRRTDHEIIQVDFQKATAAVSFTSPIMTLASTPLADGRQCLAVGCQDGTVRVLEYSRQAGVQNGKARTIVVDGPIMSLDLCYSGNDELHLLVGSMCGYVCRMTRVSKTWHGPDLVVEGLWNGESEDAVLAVCGMTKHRIAIGTHSGWLYIVTHAAGMLLWKCLLPYAIHAIMQDGEKLIVTTKRTLHVLEENAPTTSFSASLAKERLETIVAEQKVRNAEHVEMQVLEEEEIKKFETLAEPIHPINEEITTPQEVAEASNATVDAENMPEETVVVHPEQPVSTDPDITTTPETDSQPITTDAS
jgi:hypothetical protein